MDFVNLSLALFAGVIIFILVPVEGSNQLLDQAEVMMYKKHTRIIHILELCSLILTVILGLSHVADCIPISLFALSGMLICGKIKTRNIIRLT